MLLESGSPVRFLDRSGPLWLSKHSGLNLWPDLLRLVSAHAPSEVTGNRRAVAARLNEIKELRNRAFYHEPIWRRDLPKEYENILTEIGL